MTGATADTRIKTILTADSNEFEAGLRRAANTLQQAEGKFKSSTQNMQVGIGGVTNSMNSLAKTFGLTLGISAVVGLGNQILQVGDKLQTLEDRTGVSSQAFRSWQADIENSGGSLDSFSSSIVKMQVKIGQLTSGSAEAAKIFAAIGVSADDLRGKNPQQQVELLAQKIQGIEDPAQQAAAAFAIFGKGIAENLPFLRDFDFAAQSSVGWLDELTAAMGPAQVQRLDEYGDALNTLAIRATNLAAKGLVNVVQTMRTLNLQAAQFGIIVGRGVGLIDKDVADFALEDVAGRIDGAFDAPKPTDKPTVPDVGFDPEAGGKADTAAKNVDKLEKALRQMNATSEQNILTANMTELDKKLADVEFRAQQLADQYDTKLTPAMRGMIEVEKAHIRAMADIERQTKINRELAGDIGSAFGEAFEQAALEAESFGDVMENLGKRIQRALYNAVVARPLENFFGDLFNASGGAGGAGGGIGSVFSSIGGSIGTILGFAGGGRPPIGKPYMVGENGPELRVDGAPGQIIPNHALGGGGGQVNLTVINNTDAKITSQSQKNGDTTDLILQIDQIMGQKINEKDSATSRALQARENRTLIRR